MFFTRSKVLTGLVTFSMAAAVMGAPVNAMGYSARLEATADLNPVTGNVITPENAQAELVADAVLSIVGSGQNVKAKKESADKKAVIDAASEKSSLKQDEKIELAVAAPNVYLNIHTDASLGSEVIGKLYSNDVAKILQDNGGDWVKIKSGELVGYVLGEYLVKGEEAQLLSELVKKNVAVVDNSDNEVQVHKYKSDKSVMMTVSQGEQIAVEEDMEDETDGWIEVSTENGKGYVKSDEVSVTDAYPVAETAQEQQERIENATVKEIADDAQMKADKASEVAQAAAEKAEEAVSVIEDEDAEPTKAEEKLAETAQAVAEKARHGLQRLHDGSVFKLRSRASPLRRIPEGIRHRDRFSGGRKTGRSDLLLRTCRNLYRRRNDGACVQRKGRHQGIQSGLPLDRGDQEDLLLIFGRTGRFPAGNRTGMIE